MSNLKGHNPNVQTLNIYDTKEEKRLEFLHTRSFVNVHAATGWTASSGGQFPYENKIKLFTNEGEPDITTRYQPQVTIQPNVNASCSPANFPYAETTGINEVTLYANSIPDVTKMLPIVIVLTETGVPFGTTNASTGSRNSTILQTAIQLSRNYFLIDLEPTQNKTLKEEIITFNIIAMKGEEYQEIDYNLDQIANNGVLFNLDGTKIISPTGENLAFSIYDFVHNGETLGITFELTIPKDTIIKNKAAYVSFPINAGTVFITRATVATTSAEVIDNQTYKYDINFGSLSRASNGVFYYNKEAVGYEGISVSVDRISLDNNRTPATGTLRIVNSEGVIKAIALSSSSPFIFSLTELEKLGTSFAGKIEFLSSGAVRASKPLLVNLDHQGLVVQSSSEYILPGVTDSLELQTYSLLSSGFLVPEAGILRIYKNNINPTNLLKQFDSGLRATFLISSISEEDFAELKNLVIEFTATDGRKINKLISIIGATEENPVLFTLIPSPPVVTVSTLTDGSARNPEDTAIKFFVYMGESNRTEEFEFEYQPNSFIELLPAATAGDYTAIGPDNELKVSKISTITNRVSILVRAKLKANPGIVVTSLVTFNSTSESEIIQYYTHIAYKAKADSASILDETDSDGKTIYGPFMGIAVTTSDARPTAASDYRWTPYDDSLLLPTLNVYVKYSEDGRTFTPAEGDYGIGDKPSKFRGITLPMERTTAPVEPEDFGLYEWKQFFGSDGKDGRDGSKVYIRYSKDGSTFASGTIVAGDNDTAIEINIGETPSDYMGVLIIEDPDSPYYNDLPITRENESDIFNLFSWTKITGPEGVKGDQGTPGGLVTIFGPTTINLVYRGGVFEPEKGSYNYTAETLRDSSYQYSWEVLLSESGVPEWKPANEVGSVIGNVFVLNPNSDQVTGLEFLTVKVSIIEDNTIVGSDIATTYFLSSLSGNYYAELLIEDTNETSYIFKKDQYANIISGTVSSKDPVSIKVIVYKGTTNLSASDISGVGVYSLKNLRVTYEDSLPVLYEGGYTSRNTSLSTDIKNTVVSTFTDSNGIESSIIKPSFVFTILDIMGDSGFVEATVIAENAVEIPIRFEWTSTIQGLSSGLDKNIAIYSNQSVFKNNSLSLDDLKRYQQGIGTPDLSGFVKDGLLEYPSIKLYSNSSGTEFGRWELDTGNMDSKVLKNGIILSANIMTESPITITGISRQIPEVIGGVPTGNKIDDPSDTFYTAIIAPYQYYLLYMEGATSYNYTIANDNGVDIKTLSSSGQTFIYSPIESYRIYSKSKIKVFRLEQSDHFDKVKRDNFLAYDSSIPGILNEIKKEIDLNAIDKAVFISLDSDNEINLTNKDTIISSTDMYYDYDYNTHTDILVINPTTATKEVYFKNYYSSLTITAKTISNQISSIKIVREFFPYNSLEVYDSLINKIVDINSISISDYGSLKKLHEQAQIKNAELTSLLNNAPLVSRPKIENKKNLAKSFFHESSWTLREKAETDSLVEVGYDHPNSMFSASLQDKKGYIVSFTIKSDLEATFAIGVRENKTNTYPFQKEGNTLSANVPTKFYYLFYPSDVSEIVFVEDDWNNEAASVAETTVAIATEEKIHRDISNDGVKAYIFELYSQATNNAVINIENFSVLEVAPALSYVDLSLLEKIREFSTSEYNNISSLLSLSEDISTAIEKILSVLQNKFESGYLSFSDITASEITDINTHLSSAVGEPIINGNQIGSLLDALFRNIWSNQSKIESLVYNTRDALDLKKNFDIIRASDSFSMGYYDENMFISGLQITPLGTVIKDEKVQIIASTSIGSLYSKKIVIGRDIDEESLIADKEGNFDGGFIGVWDEYESVWSSSLSKRGHVFYRYNVDAAKSLVGYMIMDASEIAAYQFNTAISTFDTKNPYFIEKNPITQTPIFKIEAEGQVFMRNITTPEDGSISFFGSIETKAFTSANITRRKLDGTTETVKRSGVVFISMTGGN